MVNLVYTLPWLVNGIFFLAFIPQIRLNYKLKSTGGLSDAMLVLYLNGFWAFLTYAYCLNLPLAYRVMIPAMYVGYFIILAQRWLYAPKRPSSFFTLVFMNGLLLVGCSVLAVWFPYFVGNMAGWANVIIWTVYQVPQIFHLAFRRSVKGFSVILALMYGLGEMIELSYAIILGLPIQTMINDIRGILIFFIFCYQFWCYRTS